MCVNPDLFHINWPQPHRQSVKEHCCFLTTECTFIISATAARVWRKRNKSRTEEKKQEEDRGEGCVATKHNKSEPTAEDTHRQFLLKQRERADFWDDVSLCGCLRGTHSIMRRIWVDTSHSRSVAAVQEEEEKMNYSASSARLWRLVVSYGEAEASLQQQAAPPRKEAVNDSLRMEHPKAPRFSWGQDIISQSSSSRSRIIAPLLKMTAIAAAQQHRLLLYHSPHTQDEMTGPASLIAQHLSLSRSSSWLSPAFMLLYHSRAIFSLQIHNLLLGSSLKAWYLWSWENGRMKTCGTPDLYPNTFLLSNTKTSISLSKCDENRLRSAGELHFTECENSDSAFCLWEMKIIQALKQDYCVTAASLHTTEQTSAHKEMIHWCGNGM